MRYSMATPADELIEEFEATLVADGIEPRFNIVPTDRAPIVVATRTGERRLGLSRFGFIPHWAKDLKVGVRMLNARAETVAEKPAYRDAFLRHRCLVAADGFYEWRREGGQKIPIRFVVPDRRAFGLAGLWSTWRDGDRKVSSFTILTRAAEGAVAHVHDRMPVILPRASYGAWLDRGLSDRDALEALVAAHRGAELVGYEVSKRVGQVRNDDPTLIEPVPGA